MTADYSSITTEEFDNILLAIVQEMSAEYLLTIGDIAATLSEELNNAVLARWENENPERAFPENGASGQDRDNYT